MQIKINDLCKNNLTLSLYQNKTWGQNPSLNYIEGMLEAEYCKGFVI